MPTQDQILERLKSKQQEALNFEPDVLLDYLDFDHVREFLKEGVTAEQWGKGLKPNPLQEGETYMKEYGWPKVLNHRGISASRTIQKMTAWAFLADDQKALEIIETTGYAQYGAPILLSLCKHWGWDVPDDPSVGRMAAGQSCTPDCHIGCGQ